MRDPTEDLLREVVTGDRAESDAEVQRALRDHPGLRTRLDRLRALSAQLDAAGALQRAILGAPEDEASARLPAIDIGAVGRRRRVRRWWLVVAALALGALGGVAWWSSRDGAAAGTEHDLPLGTGEWELTIDRDPAAASPRLRWHDPDGPLRPGQHYEIRLFTRPTDIEPAGTFATGRQPTWTPSEAELRSFPDPFYYEVTVVGLDGLERASKLSGSLRR